MVLTGEFAPVATAFGDNVSAMAAHIGQHADHVVLPSGHKSCSSTSSVVK